MRKRDKKGGKTDREQTKERKKDRGRQKEKSKKTEETVDQLSLSLFFPFTETVVHTVSSANGSTPWWLYFLQYFDLPMVNLGQERLAQEFIARETRDNCFAANSVREKERHRKRGKRDGVKRWKERWREEEKGRADGREGVWRKSENEGERQKSENIERDRGEERRNY